MKNQTVRKDNKSLMVHYDICFILLLIGMFILNIWNTKEVKNMYTMAIIMVIAIVSYFIFYYIEVKRGRAPLELEDNYLAFYVSSNKHNKAYKLSIVLFDLLSFIGTLIIAYYFFYKMNFVSVYKEYPLFLLLFLGFTQITILIKDIIKINKIDRIDALNDSTTFSILDKKLVFFLSILSVCVLNILMLSFKKPHFIVYYKDLVIFEILAHITLLFNLITIVINKVYYYHFNIKQIEQKNFNTKFLEEIGTGSYATVYKAYLPSLDKVFALKKLITNDTEQILRFEAEFKMMKPLSHPNIISVYSYDEIKYEFIMDFMPYTLEEYLQKNTLTLEQKYSLIEQLLEGMNYLHKHNILHRDLSFQNVMISEDEILKDLLTLKITDFGIARDKSINRKFTKTGAQTKGTLIDPLLDDLKDFNIKNELFSIGFIINYIYFGAEGIKVDSSVISKIIHKCMALDFESRYNSVSEILKDLRQMEV